MLTSQHEEGGKRVLSIAVIKVVRKGSSTKHPLLFIGLTGNRFRYKHDMTKLLASPSPLSNKLKII